MNLKYNNYFDERQNCPVCNQNNLTEVFKSSFLDKKISNFTNLYYSNRIPKNIFENTNYLITKCNICSCLFQKFILNDNYMNELYESWISKDESLNKKINYSTYNFNKYVNDLEKISKYLNKKPKDIKILEFGMGWGFWSRIAKSMNFNITGFEISESRLNFAKKNNIKIINNLDELKKEKFDFIYSFAVFEHIKDPHETLKMLKDLLNKNGMIYIYVPNGIFAEKKFKKDWKATKDALHPLEHINCFNRKALSVLGKNNNLKINYNIFQPRYKNLASYPKEIIKHIYNNTFSTGIFYSKINS